MYTSCSSCIVQYTGKSGFICVANDTTCYPGYILAPTADFIVFKIGNCTMYYNILHYITFANSLCLYYVLHITLQEDIFG